MSDCNRLLYLFQGSAGQLLIARLLSGARRRIIGSPFLVLDTRVLALGTPSAVTAGTDSQLMIRTTTVMSLIIVQSRPRVHGGIRNAIRQI